MPRVRFPSVILIFLSVDWTIFSRRPMVRALAQAAAEYDSTVIAINRPLCMLTTAVRKPHRFPELFGRARMERLDERLYLFSPKYFLHDYIAGRLPPARFCNLYALRKGLLLVCRKLGIEVKSPMIWYYHPIQSYVTELFPESVNIFELYDGLSDLEGVESRRIQRLEQRQRKQVDIILTTSRTLHQRYAPHYKCAISFGNGLERAAYHQLMQRAGKELPKLGRIPKPRLGYAGVISRRIDWNLIAALAFRNPQWSFVFVGRRDDESDRGAVSTLENVHFLDPVAQEDVPKVLRSFELAILPYRDTPFFHYLNPLKFYESAAAGLRTVSSLIPELNQFPQELVTAVPNDPAAWASAIHRMLDTVPLHTDDGPRLAARFIWEDMVPRLLTHIADTIRQLDRSGK